MKKTVTITACLTLLFSLAGLYILWIGCQTFLRTVCAVLPYGFTTSLSIWLTMFVLSALPQFWVLFWGKPDHIWHITQGYDLIAGGGVAGISNYGSSTYSLYKSPKLRQTIIPANIMVMCNNIGFGGIILLLLIHTIRSDYTGGKWLVAPILLFIIAQQLYLFMRLGHAIYRVTHSR